MIIVTPQVVKGDADLQDALIEKSDIAPFGSPELFERLVLLEKRSAVELGDNFKQQQRRWLVEPVRHSQDMRTDP